MALLVCLLIIVFLTVAQTLVPYLVRRTVVFGVTIPEQYINDSTLLKYKKQYTLFNILIAVLLAIIYIYWVFSNDVSEELLIIVGTMIAFSIMIISISLYFYFHGKTMQLKLKNKWNENLKQVKVSDLTVRSQDEMLPWYAYIFPMIVTVGLMIYTVLNYDLLPNQIPIHWGPSGEPDDFTEKTPLTALQLPAFILLLQGMFLAIHIATKKSGIKLSATNTTASKRRQLGLRKYTSWIMILVVLMFTMMMSFFQLTMIHPEAFEGIILFIVPFVALMIILIGTLIFSIIIGRSDKEGITDVIEDITDLDEDRYWKGGIWYFNKNDPSIFVEKRFGVGWTLNFANPLGLIIVLLPIVIILLVTFFLN